jgi:exopolyphosphatase / guanosine-5'-triphosphate,3'-diphosphate pyrophosphatase
MNKNVAVIDLGTNTFQLGIAKIHSNSFEYVFEKSLAPKLGKNGINKSILQADALGRGLEALAEMQENCKEYGVLPQNIYLIGTSALRNANNASDFVDAVLQKMGWQLQIIDGNTEAQLIAIGVQYALGADENAYLIMDIGGGSVEFIIIENTRILWKKSIEIGGQRLMELFFDADPISHTQQNRLKTYLQEQLLPLQNALHQYQAKHLVGAAGSFETLADIYNSSIGVDGSNLISTKLPIDSFYNSYAQFLQKNQKQRLAIPGMKALRVDMIVVASVLIEVVLKLANTEQITVCNYALKEGVLAALAKNEPLFW